MKTQNPSLPTRIISLVCAVTVTCAASLHAQTEVFSDNFNRTNGAVGNGWTISSTGNGGSGGGTAPNAAILDNELSIERSGWGPDASITLTQDISDADSLSATMLTPSATGGTTNGTEYSSLIAKDSSSGAYIRVSLFNSNNTGDFNIRVASSDNGSWPGWGYDPASSIANPGELSVNITLGDAGAVNVSATKPDTTVVASWSTTNTGFSDSSFDQIIIGGNWTEWTSPTGYQLSVDDISAIAIPEPASAGMLIGILCLCGTLTSRKQSRS